MASTLVLGQQGWRESIGDRSKLETAATSEMDDCFHNYLAKIKVRTIENLSFWLMQLSMIMLRFHSLPGSKEKPEVRRVVF